MCLQALVTDAHRPGILSLIWQSGSRLQIYIGAQDRSMAPGLVARPPPQSTRYCRYRSSSLTRVHPSRWGVLKKSKGLSMLIVCAWALAWRHPVVAHGMDEHPVAVRVFNVAYLLLDARTA